MQQMPGEGGAQQFGDGGSGDAAAAGWHASLGLGGSGGSYAMQQMPVWGADFDAAPQTHGVDLSSSQIGATDVCGSRSWSRSGSGASCLHFVIPSLRLASANVAFGEHAPCTSKKCVWRMRPSNHRL